MDTIKLANKIIREGVALFPEDIRKKNFMAIASSDVYNYEAINNACGAVNGNEEKEAMLEAWAVQEANRVVSALWRDELLTPELEAEYRKLPKMVEVEAKYNEFTASRQARMNKIMEDHKVIANEERELDIFKGIINGVPAEESEKRYEEYRNQQQAAMRK